VQALILLPLHGIGGRQDLPIPFGLAIGGAGIAIALSFVVLGLAWRNPKYRGNASGKPLPGAITRRVLPLRDGLADLRR
jgi:hypothetical protein